MHNKEPETAPRKERVCVTIQKTNHPRQDRRRRFKRRALAGLGLILMAMAGWGGYWLSNSPWFDLKQILVEGNQTIQADDLRRLTGVRLGANILKVSTGDLAQNLKVNPFVKTSEVKRRYPDKLLIRITERTPAAIVSNSGRYLVLDEEGYCLQSLTLMSADRSDLPRIEAGSELQTLKPCGKTEDKGALAALALIRQLDPFFMENIREFRAPSEWELALITRDGLTVYFGPPENLSQKLQYYEELLVKNAAECNAETLEYVDLRYDAQPVIKRKENLDK